MPARCAAAAREGGRAGGRAGSDDGPFAPQALPVLDAPMRPDQEYVIRSWGLATTVLQDIPQLVISVIANTRRKNWTNTATASILGSIVTLSMGLSKKMVAAALVFSSAESDSERIMQQELTSPLMNTHADDHTEAEEDLEREVAS
jgi:hypothetical protein